MRRKVFAKFASLCLVLALMLSVFSACNTNKPSTSSSASSSSSSDNGTNSSTDSSLTGGDTTSGTSTSDTAGTETVGTVTTKKGTTTKTSLHIVPPPVINLKGRTITYSAWWTEPKEGSSASANLYWEAKRYVQTKYNCKIAFKVRATADDSASLMSSILAGSPSSDWFSLGQQDFYAYAFKGLLKPLSDLKNINPRDTNKWAKIAMDYCTINGKVYGVFTGDPAFRSLLLYNKSKINGANDLYTLQSKNQLTWTKIFDIAKSISTDTFGGIAGSINVTDLMDNLISANGGVAVTRGSGFDFKYTLDSPNTRTALQTFQDWYKAGILYDVGGQAWTYAATQFGKGKFGMFVADGYQIPDIYKAAKFDVGMVLFPAGPNGKAPLVDQSTQVLDCIASTTKNPDDVALVMNALTSYERSKAPDWKTAWADIIDDSNNLKVMQTYLDTVLQGKAFVDYRSAVVTDSFAANGIYDTEANCASGNTTPETCLETIKPVYQAFIDNFKKK